MENNFSNAERAEVLTQALPNIKRYNGKIVVIKYGGNANVTLTHCTIVGNVANLLDGGNVSGDFVEIGNVLG